MSKRFIPTINAYTIEVANGVNVVLLRHSNWSITLTPKDSRALAVALIEQASNAEKNTDCACSACSDHEPCEFDCGHVLRCSHGLSMCHMPCGHDKEHENVRECNDQR